MTAEVNTIAPEGAEKYVDFHVDDVQAFRLKDVEVCLERASSVGWGCIWRRRPIC